MNTRVRTSSCHSSLSNESLHQNTLLAAQLEKKSTLALLEYLHEIDFRRLYAEYGYSSLWEYVHRALGYSDSQAYERVSAMRIMAQIPEVKKSLEENKLTLTSTAKLAAFVKREDWKPAETTHLLTKIENKSSRAVEQILMQHQSQPTHKPDHMKVIGSEALRISFDADLECMDLLKRVKELQNDPTLSIQDLVKKTFQEYIQKRAATGSPQVKEKSKRVVLSAKQQPQPQPQPKKTTLTAHSRYISQEIKNFVRNRSRDQCEYVQLQTQQRCRSRSQLQFDHIIPYALGGKSTLENIQHLCRAHNLHAAEKIFQRRWV